jgi:hypothetical protein
MMALYVTPETHAANPPDSWQVRKVSERSWQLVDTTGAVLETTTTRREAERLKLSGNLVALYDKEGRWFAGESVPGWKPYLTTESRP